MDNRDKISMIETEGLTKYYGDLCAINRISFKVKEREIFGFLGPNGAGKTTTQRILIGALKPDRGRAMICGYDIQRESFHAKSVIGVVPEVPNFYTDFSPWENLMLTGELYRVPGKKRKERAEDLLKTFGIYHKRDKKSKELSKGMKQRLLLCLALIHNPLVLFLDEPTSGLDVQSSRLIRDIIRELNQKGATIFLTTHNIEEANELCDRIAIIDHGKIATIDSPENLKKTFQSVQSVEVTFSPPLDKIDSLKDIPGVNEIKKLGDKFRLYTENQTEVISALIDFARRRNLKLITLNTLRPSLEEVFVIITEEHKGWNYGNQ